MAAAMLVMAAAGVADAKPAPKANLKVQSTGAGGKRVLRLSLGTTVERVTAAIDMNLTMMGMAMPMPGLRAQLTFDPAGAAKRVSTYNVKFTKVSVDKTGNANPALTSGLARELKQLTGLRGKARVDTRGFIDVTLANKASGSPQAQVFSSAFAAALEQLTVPLPKQAVGVGARWAVAQTTTQNGLTIDQDVTFTIKAIDGNRITFGVVVALSAKAQTVKIPGGASLKLKRLSGSGRGTTVIDLRRLAPVRAAMKATSKAQFEGPNGGQPLELVTTVDTVIASK